MCGNKAYSSECINVYSESLLLLHMELAVYCKPVIVFLIDLTSRDIVLIVSMCSSVLYVCVGVFKCTSIVLPPCKSVSLSFL